MIRFSNGAIFAEFASTNLLQTFFLETMGFVKIGAKKSKLSLGRKDRRTTKKRVELKVTMKQPRKRETVKRACERCSTSSFAAEEDGGDFCPFSEQAQRVHIAMVWYFDFEHEPKECWDGKGGTIAQLCNAIKFLKPNPSDRRKVKRVLENASKAMAERREYTGARASAGHNEALIVEGDLYFQMVVDFMEQGLGLTHTMYRINEHSVTCDGNDNQMATAAN